jgi:hypothetical protein
MTRALCRGFFDRKHMAYLTVACAGAQTGSTALDMISALPVLYGPPNNAYAQ